MARTFGANQYLTKASALFGAAPFSFAAWVNITSFAGNPVGFVISTATATNYFVAQVDSTGHPMASANQTGTVISGTATTALTLNTWGHICMVFTSATARTAYCNGGGAGTSAATSTIPAGMTVTYVGGDPTANFGDNLSGQLAFPAFWNVALTATDVAALAAGAHPRLIRPGALASCINLTGGGSPEPDLISATGWTINGAPTESANPRIYM